MAHLNPPFHLLLGLSLFLFERPQLDVSIKQLRPLGLKQNLFPRQAGIGSFYDEGSVYPILDVISVGDHFDDVPLSVRLFDFFSRITIPGDNKPYHQ